MGANTEQDLAPSAGHETRARRMGLLARADGGRLAALWQAAGLTPDYRWLRPPETGLVMVRGRAGGSGDPFNLGEMTVTRCAVALASGEIGHACVPGRSHEHARLAALVDAAAERPDLAAAVGDRILAPLAAEEDQRRQRRGRETEATRVSFTTMERERP